MLDLKKMASMLESDVDSYCAEFFNEGHRKHLGASILGNKCDRAIWYNFRWVLNIPFEGRLRRLFNRGHREEQLIIQWLRGIGCVVSEFRPDSRLFLTEARTYVVVNGQTGYPATWQDVSDIQEHLDKAMSQGIKRKQYGVSFAGGHGGGSCDGIVQLPARFEYSEPVLLEMKTSNSKSFAKLKEHGVREVKPEHVIQMNIYGEDVLPTPIRLALYVCVNKDNDEIYYEFVELNTEVSTKARNRAARIINSGEAPAKISQLAGSFDCRFCDYAAICHFGASYETNCRSCKQAKPYDNKVWYCHAHNVVLTDEIIEKGCPNHEPA